MEQQAMEVDDSNDTEQNWATLPAELLMHVFSFLSPRVISFPVSLVCWRWHDISIDSRLWKYLYCQRWKPSQQDELCEHWKATYISTNEIDNNWKRFRPTDKSRTTSFKPHQKVCLMMVDFDDDKIVTCSQDHTFRVIPYKVGPSGMVIGTTQTFMAGNWLNCVQLEAGRWVFTGGDGGLAHLWDLAAPGAWDADPLEASGKAEKLSFKGHRGSILGLRYHPERKQLATGSSAKTVKLWDIETGQEVLTLSGHEDGVRAVEFACGGECLATGSYDRTVRLWDLRSGQCGRKASNSGNVSRLQLDDEKLVTASYDGNVRRFDFTTFKCVQEYRGNGQRIFGLQYDDKFSKIVSSSVGVIRIWDIESGEVYATYQEYSKYPLHSLKYTDTLMVVASFDGSAYVHYFGPLTLKRKRGS